MSTADFPTLAERIQAALSEHSTMSITERGYVCTCGTAIAASGLIADVVPLWQKHRAEDIATVIHPVLETVDQLDALPPGSVIGCGTGGGLYEKDTSGGWGFPPDCPAYLIDEAWAAGTSVRLVWHPEVDR